MSSRPCPACGAPTEPGPGGWYHCAGPAAAPAPPDPASRCDGRPASSAAPASPTGGGAPLQLEDDFDELEDGLEDEDDVRFICDDCDADGWSDEVYVVGDLELCGRCAWLRRNRS